MSRSRTGEFVKVFLGAFAVMLALPLAYRIWIHFNPQQEGPAHSLSQFLEEAKGERCTRLLAKPAAKWTDAETSSEPEIYGWLVEHDEDIQPWEWTQEARRKDPRGHAKAWLRIWNERRRICERSAEKHRRDAGRIDEELRILTAIYSHRTNQIARLEAFSATNEFPCRISLERLLKGRFWGWNRKVETFECASAEAVVAATNSICSKECEAAMAEADRKQALSESLVSAKERLAVCEGLRDAAAQNIRLVEDASFKEEALRKSLVESLKAVKCAATPGT